MNNKITKSTRELIIKDYKWFEKKLEIVDTKMAVIKKEVSEIIEVLELEDE